MSKLNVYNGGAWQNPSNISVYNGGTSSWTPVEKVYYNVSGSWVEVWPLSSPPIAADFAIITITAGRYSDLLWEVWAQNPAYMVQTRAYGGYLVQSPDINGSNKNFLLRTNPRNIWFPEIPINSPPYSARLGRPEMSPPLTYVNYHTGTYDPNLLVDERMGVLTDLPTIPELLAGYNQVCLYYNNLYDEFMTNGFFDFSSPMSPGDLFRFAFQAAWPADWTYNPNDYPITFTIDVYQGGTIVRDPTTKVYSGSGFTQKQTYTQVYVAPKYDIQTAEFLPSDCTAFYMDYDFTATQITIAQPTPPAVVNTLPRFIEIRNVASKPGVHPVVWINDPLMSPTLGAVTSSNLPNYPPLDTPVYSNAFGLLHYDVYPLRSVANGSTELQFSPPGMGSTAVETIQQDGRYNGGLSLVYPFRDTTNLTTRWWLSGGFVYGPGTGDTQYVYFDPVQYRWDNPTIDQVELTIQAWYETGYAPGTETFNVYGWPNPTKGNDAASSIDGTGGVTYGSFTKSITASGASGTPRFGTNVGKITINFVTNTVTLTAL